MALTRLRRLFVLVALALSLLAAASKNIDDAPVEVIEVAGIIDDAALEYIDTAIEEASARRELVIIQIDSGATVADLDRLTTTSRLLSEPPLPVVIWVGPVPARVGGGAAQLLASAPLTAAAPGAVIAHWDPATVGDEGSIADPPVGFQDPTVISAPIPDLIELVSPSIRQLLQDLDGRQIEAGGQNWTLATITETAGGVTTVPVTFSKPGLWHRFLHLGATPEAAFFFLAAGLTVAAFEFYALGPGIAAVVAGLSLLLSGYGMAVLPVRPGAVLLTLLGVGLLTAGYQQGGVLGFTILGTVALATGGLTFVGGAPQITIGWLAVVATVLAVLFFYLLAMPTVGRSRFSTPTLGRQYLIGKSGKARVDLAPDGVVEVEGGRWPATTHREARVIAGDPIRVVAVDGWQLEVEPDREN